MTRLPRGVVPVPPGPGQESCWDYPRPPRVEPTTERVQVVLGGTVVCDTRRALRVLETSHPASYYLPLDDWVAGALEPRGGEYTGRVSSDPMPPYQQPM